MGRLLSFTHLLVGDIMPNRGSCVISNHCLLLFSLSTMALKATHTLNLCLLLVRWLGYWYMPTGGHSAVVSVLLDAGADIDLREGDCDTP